MLAQVIYLRYRIGEVSCPTKYFPEASSINFSRSVKYGLGVMVTSLEFRLQRMGLGRFRFLDPNGRRLVEDYYLEIKDSHPQESHT